MNADKERPCEKAVNVAIGSRLKTLRKEAGYKKIRLCEFLNVSMQQMHKYESGANRISAAKLYVTAKTLNIPVSRFFEISEDLASSAQAAKAADEKGEKARLDSIVESFYAIESEGARNKVLNLLKNIIKEN